MIRLIASDLDGTLLPEGTADIDSKIYEVIRGLQRAGITFVAASGRNYESVMSVFGSMEKELTVISDNGGYCAKGGVEVYCNEFPEELLHEIISMVRAVPGVWMLASAARGAYTETDDPEFVRWIREGYQMSLRENVEISAGDSDFDKMKQCVQNSEFFLDERFENGYDTMLSREFDGIDLSGGQWQRVALARGLYRDSRLILLDEPTSAIDPIEEGKLYRKFQNIIQDKMGVIVTHRLGSARIADRILVLHEGKIVEQGTHDELLRMCGHYTRMYEEQAKWYNKSC